MSVVESMHQPHQALLVLGKNSAVPLRPQEVWENQGDSLGGTAQGAVRIVRQLLPPHNIEVLLLTLPSRTAIRPV